MKLLLPIVHVIFVLAIADHSVAHTQGLRFNRVFGSSGVSLENINTVVQEKYGFIWLADHDNQCIVPFDGGNLIWLKTKLRNPNFQGEANPQCLPADSLRNIWIGFCGRGLDHLDRETGALTHFTSLDKIFQPFFTIKPTGEGTGLGLSLSYDIITKGHDGEIKVDTVEGYGTAFTIFLPV